VKPAASVYCPKCRKVYDTTIEDNTYVFCYYCHTPVLHRATKLRPVKELIPDPLSDDELIQSEFIKGVFVLYVICLTTQPYSDVTTWSIACLGFLALSIVSSGIWILLIDIY
jgi:hypothetical protein